MNYNNNYKNILLIKSLLKQIVNFIIKKKYRVFNRS